MGRIIGRRRRAVKQPLAFAAWTPYNVELHSPRVGHRMSRVIKKRRKKMRKHKYSKLRKKLRHKRK
jgi:hypothetical protein